MERDGTRLHHVGIVVRSIDAALPYFRDELRLPLLSDERVPAVGVRLALLDGGGAMVQLVEPIGPGPIQEHLDGQGEGLHHLCLAVPDIERGDRPPGAGRGRADQRRRARTAGRVPAPGAPRHAHGTGGSHGDRRRKERGNVGRLDGKVCVVTGGASGIGQGAARAFVAEGATVGLLDRNEAAIAETVAELGDAAFPLPSDVTEEASVEAAFAEVKRRHGRLDVLYTCAAVQLIGEDAPVHELSLEVWERTHAVNLRGVFLSCKHGVRADDRGRQRRHRSSTAGSPTGLTMCGAGWHAYSSSKAGVMALTRVMAADLAQYGIRVNGIVPGSIRTSLTKPLFDDPEIARPPRSAPPDRPHRHAGGHGRDRGLPGLRRVEVRHRRPFLRRRRHLGPLTHEESATA